MSAINYLCFKNQLYYTKLFLKSITNRKLYHHQKQEYIYKFGYFWIGVGGICPQLRKDEVKTLSKINSFKLFFSKSNIFFHYEITESIRKTKRRWTSGDIQSCFLSCLFSFGKAELVSITNECFSRVLPDYIWAGDNRHETYNHSKSTNLNILCVLL